MHLQGTTASSTTAIRYKYGVPPVWSWTGPDAVWFGDAQMHDERVDKTGLPSQIRVRPYPAAGLLCMQRGRLIIGRH